MVAWHWIAVGVVLALLEIKVPGVSLIWMGAAAIFVGAMMIVWPDMTWQVQILSFLVTAGLSIACALYTRKRWPAKADAAAHLNVGSSRLIGERGTLQAAIVNGHGQVRLGDSVWPCRGPELPAGAPVRVTASDGVTLKVISVHG